MSINPLDQFESEQKIINELRDLFEFVTPQTLRRNVEDLFFHHMTSLDEAEAPSKDMTKNIYYLINFLNVVEEHKRY